MAAVIASSQVPSRPNQLAHQDTDDDEEGDCCPFATPAVNLALLACLCSCPPRSGPMRDIMRSSLEVSIPTLHTLIDSTIVYIVSRKWKDLFSIYIFRLTPRPFCVVTTHAPPPPSLPFLPPWPLAPPSPPAPPLSPHSPSAPPLSPMAPPPSPPPPYSPPLPPPPPDSPRAEVGCGEVADPMWLYVFAICTLLLLGCVVRAAARLEGHWRWPSLTIVPSMCGMWVGWAMGDASVELLTRLNAHAQNFRFCTSCNGFNILFSFGFTIVTAVLMLMLRPITRAAALSSSKAAMSPRHGGGAYAGACRYACSSFIAWGVAVAELLAQGLSYNVMMLWGFTFKHVITWGVSYTQSGTPLLGRTLFLWAAFLTVIGSMLTVRLSKWRLWLERRQNLVRRDLNLATPRSLRAREQPSSEELPATISDAQMPPVHLPAASGVPPTGVPPTGVLPTGVTESHPPLGSVSSAASGGGAGGAPGCALSAAQVDGDASGCDAVASSFHSPPPPTTFSRCSSFTPSALLSGFEPSRLRPAVAENVAKTLAQIDRRLGRRVALGQFLVLLEASLAWVAGVAWTDAVVELSEMRIYPDPSVVFHDTLLALLATILAFVITIATGSSFSDLDDKQKASREAVEGYFTMYALSFIVGWGWVVVLRDYETLLANMVTNHASHPRPHTHGLNTRCLMTQPTAP